MTKGPADSSDVDVWPGGCFVFGLLAVASFLWVAGVSVALDDPFVGCEFPESHGASGVHFLCADSDFGSESELGAVGEGGAGVDVAAGGVDFAEEALGGLLVFGYDGFGVFEAVVVDVLEGLVDGVDGDDGQFHGEVLAAVVVGLNGEEEFFGIGSFEGVEGAAVGVEFDAF